MAKPVVSLKRIQINRANTVMMVTIAISAFVVVFSLVASRALWNKRSFQGRLIAEKEKAVLQLNQNVETVDDLVVAYKAFVETPDNVIGGNPNGNGDNDGDNAKIVLNALPSKYDFPALATSLEKIIKSEGHDVDSISGTDEEIAQSSQENPVVAPVEMNFEVSSSGNLKNSKELLSIFERSIRPLKIGVLEMSGGNTELNISVTAKTYYQPETTLKLQKKVVK